MRLTKKQEQAIVEVSKHIPVWVKDWTLSFNDAQIGLLNCKEDPNGVFPEVAFFMKTETGKLPEKVVNIKRLRALLWGQRWMAVEKSRKIK